MKRLVNLNYIRASYLILVSAALGVVNYMLVGSFTAFAQLTIVMLTITLLFVMALLIRNGYEWAKWAFIVITALGFTTIYVAIPAVFNVSAIAGCIAVLQNVLYLVAVALLLIPSKHASIDSTTESTII